MKNPRVLFLSLTAVLGASQASAESLPVQRGPDIRPNASFCSIGPFPQVGKAGEYNLYCTQLTDAEKCLALVKFHMSPRNGELRPADPFDGRERAQYCLEEFRRGLLE